MPAMTAALIALAGGWAMVATVTGPRCSTRTLSCRTVATDFSLLARTSDRWSAAAMLMHRLRIRDTVAASIRATTAALAWRDAKCAAGVPGNAVRAAYLFDLPR